MNAPHRLLVAPLIVFATTMVILLQPDASHASITSYVVTTDLALNEQINNLADDVRNIDSYTRTTVARFAEAYAIYANGNSSLKPSGSTLRSLKGLVTTDAAVNSAIFKTLSDYWGRTSVPNEYVSQAILGQGDFAAASVENAVNARSEGAVVGLQAMHSPILMLQYMDQAVYYCRTGNAEHAMHLWDNAFSFYTGKDVVGRGRGRMFFYMVTELCQDSCTCNSHHDDTIINARIIDDFGDGRDGFNEGNCDMAATAMANVQTHYISALVQGITRELYRSDPQNINMATLTNATIADLMRRRVEGFTYLMGALPFIAKCSSSLADRLRSNLRFSATNYMQEGWQSLVEDLRAQYICLGLDNCEVGGYCIRAGSRGNTTTTMVIPTNCPTSSPTTASPTAFTVTPTAFPIAQQTSSPTPGGILDYTVTTSPELNLQLEHLALDARDIESLSRTSVGRYELAYAIYKNGNASHTPNGGGYRSLKSLVTTDAALNSTIYKTLISYWGRSTVPDEYVSQAILGQGDFAAQTVVNAVDARSEGAIVGLQAMHSPILMLQYMEHAVDQCQRGSTQFALHIWDHAFTFYTGKDAVGRGRGRMFFYMVTELCQDSCTCNSHHDDTIINGRIIESFLMGRDGLATGNCDIVKNAMAEVQTRYVESLVQGITRELYRSDPQNINMATLTNSTIADLMRRRVEGYTYLIGALPFIAKCSSSLADRLRSNLRFSATNYMQDGWQSLVDDLRAQYACLGLDNCEVGGYCIRAGSRGNTTTTMVIPTNCPTRSPSTVSPTLSIDIPTKFPTTNAATKVPTLRPVASPTSAPNILAATDYAITTQLTLNEQINNLALDVRDIETLSKTNTAKYDKAYSVYSIGNASIKTSGNGFRSLRNLITVDAATTTGIFKFIHEYWGKFTVADEYVSQAILGQGDFAALSIVNALDARSEGAVIGLQAMHSPILMLQTMEQAVDQCRLGEMQHALNLWDTAYAFFTGKDAAGRGRGRMFFYMVTELCQDSCTCASHHDNTVINGAIISSFISGREGFNEGHCASAATALWNVRGRYVAALVQGITRELYRSDPQNIDMTTLTNATIADLMRRRVEGFTYLMGALPFISRCSPSLASRLYTNMRFTSANYMQEGWRTLVNDLRSLYGCLSVTDCEVGGYCVRSGSRGNTTTTMVISSNCPTKSPIITTARPSSTHVPSISLESSSAPVVTSTSGLNTEPVSVSAAVGGSLGAVAVITLIIGVGLFATRRVQKRVQNIKEEPPLQSSKEPARAVGDLVVV